MNTCWYYSAARCHLYVGRQICKYPAKYVHILSLLDVQDGHMHRGRKRPMQRSSSIENSRIWSATFFPVTSPPCQSICSHYVDGKGAAAGGVLTVESCWRTYSAGGMVSIWYVTRFRTNKIAYPIPIPPPQDKNLEGNGGLKQRTICRKVLLQVTFNTKKFCNAFYESYLSTGTCIRKGRQS